MIQKNNKGYKTAIRYIKPGIRSNEIRKGLILCNRSFGETLILDAIINDYRPVISRTVIKLGKFVSSFFLFRVYIVFSIAIEDDTLRDEGAENNNREKIMNRWNFLSDNEKSTFQLENRDEPVFGFTFKIHGRKKLESFV